MTRLTYYPRLDTKPAPEQERTDVLWGYALTDLERAARMAIARNVGVNAFSRQDRYDIAFSAIAVTLCEAQDRPSLSDLASAGWYAIAEARNTEMRHHGIDHTRRIGETRRSFAAYWDHTPATPMDEQIVERIALAQVWPQLTVGQAEAITALAVCGTATLAATALGKTHTAYHRIARHGRNRFKTWWHEGETPPPAWGRDTRTRDGSPVDSKQAATQVRRKMRRRGGAG